MSNNKDNDRPKSSVKRGLTFSQSLRRSMAQEANTKVWKTSSERMESLVTSKRIDYAKELNKIIKMTTGHSAIRVNHDIDLLKSSKYHHSVYNDDSSNESVSMEVFHPSLSSAMNEVDAAKKDGKLKKDSWLNIIDKFKE